MPATRSTAPQVLGERKRTRAQTETSEPPVKLKSRKTDNAPSNKRRSSLSAINTTKTAMVQSPHIDSKMENSEKVENTGHSEEPSAAKRGRGRPKKVEPPGVPRNTDGKSQDGKGGVVERTNKHKDLIEVDSRGRPDSGNSSQKTGQQKLGTDMSVEGGSGTVVGFGSDRCMSKDSGHADTVGSSRNFEDAAGSDSLAEKNDAPPKSKKRGRKPKTASKVVETIDNAEKDTSQDGLVEQGENLGVDQTELQSSNRLSLRENPSKRPKTDRRWRDDGKSRKYTKVEEMTGRDSNGDGVISPRRSGRGTVPNTRYKDMHLFSSSKKQHSAPSGKTGSDNEKSYKETQLKDETKSAKKKGVVEDSRLSVDSPKLSASDSRGKEKVKPKPFSSGVSMARAQAKAQQQAEAKSRAADKISIREIAQGLEVTGRDGIPVVVSPENIVRVPLPSKQESTDQEQEEESILSDRQTGQQEKTQGIASEPSIDTDPQQNIHRSDVAGDTKCIPGESDSNVGGVGSVGAVSGTAKEDSIGTDSKTDSDSPESYSGPDTDIVEEVVETEMSSAGTGGEELREYTVESADHQTSQVVEPGRDDQGCVSDTPLVDGSQMEVEDGTNVNTSDHHKKPAVLSTHTVSTGDTAEQYQSGESSEGGKLLMMAKMNEHGNAVVLVDKTKKLPHQFLKETLSSMPPAKPGYVISSPRRNSSVVKIVTLSSMLEDSKQKKTKESELTDTVIASTSEQTTQSSLNIIQPESNTPLPSEAESRPSGVDMILAGSKTVDASEATMSVTEDRGGDTDKSICTGDSKFSSASTQTPIDREAEKTIVPTIYKSSPVPPLKTISVNLGKRELEEGEVGYEVPQEGVKPKSEEYILVELPEGATVQQRYVKSRTKIDDSMFLSSECMVQGIYRCTLCNYETSKKPNWYKHKKKHMGFREYECTQCDYRAATSSNLKRHLAIHQDLRAYSCAKCELSFRQKIHLERHIKYKHEEKQVRCPFCEYMCANENPDLKVHIKRKHLPGHSSDGTINAFTCPDCKLVTVSRRDLKQHMKFHRKGPELKLFCEHCSFVTDCESRLRRHELIHTKEKPFQCGLCDYRGSQKEHVLRHMRSMHNIDVMRRKRKSTSGEDTPSDSSQGGVKDFSKVIDKTDYSTKDKIFACNHCTMKFSKLINLYKHLHTQHRNIMPSEQEDDFSCVVCDFRTSTKKNLLVHMRKHNMTDHSPPTHLYSCVLCRYTNPKRRNLFQHMRKKHHIEIVMKDDGSTSCFVTDTSNIQEDIDHNVLTVGDVVTTTTADTDSQDDPTGVHSVISLEDLTTIVAPEPNQDGNLIIDAGQLHNATLGSLVHQHDAAEAIEGLQALASQINLADSVIEEVQVMDDPGLDPINMETTIDASKDGDGEDKPSIQMSAEHLLHLSSGDFVEINGEMYKVEISANDSAKATPATLTAIPDIEQPPV